MPPGQADVDAFIAAPKRVPNGTALAWRRRNEQVRTARVPVELGAIEAGELPLIVNIAHSRHWSFLLPLRGTEVRRHDFLPPGPRRHSNPPGRPEGWPGKDRSLEHEHHWLDGLGMTAADRSTGQRTSTTRRHTLGSAMP